MMAQNDGGPAFPQPDLSGYGMGPVEGPDGRYNMQGMTLRDWFAGQAPDLPDDLPLNMFECLVGRAYTAKFGTIEHWRFVADAEAAWKLLHADAMLAAREAPDAV